jgi:hypothetical protein
MQILISGASIAGPVLAYWLTRYGFDATVVERAPTLRKAGGHAVDLFRPSMEISAKMGDLPRIEALATGTDTLTMYSEGARHPARIDLTKLVSAASDRHVEIMRDDLSEAYYDAGRNDVEYVFGDSITAISPNGEVTFEDAAARRFDVIVGADGLHSNVRRLVFGNEAEPTRFIGGYLAVRSVYRGPRPRRRTAGPSIRAHTVANPAAQKPHRKRRPADRDLTVADFAQGARVLAGHAHRGVPILDEPGVVITHASGSIRAHALPASVLRTGSTSHGELVTNCCNRW